MNSVTVGVITYNPDIRAIERLVEALCGDYIHLQVIDNGSDNASQLAQMLARKTGVGFMAQGRNTGVAAAINKLYGVADTRGTRYMMVADQDSIFQKDHIPLLVQKFEAMEKRLPRLGAVGGRVYDEHRRHFQGFKTFRFPWQQNPSQLPNGFHHADFLISSGTLLLMDCMRDVGSMNDWLFIDSVDMDWCFRATYQNWQLLGCDHPVIKQHIGTGVLRPSGIFSRVRVHAPERYYTMTRNRLYLYRQPYSRGAWQLRDLSRACLKFCLLMLFSGQRKSICSAHWRGLREACRKHGTAEV